MDIATAENLSYPFGGSSLEFLFGNNAIVRITKYRNNPKFYLFICHENN
ncbi:MAG: hypothetical protein WC384_04535 [Prolixibacteraceae bacterium]